MIDLGSLLDVPAVEIEMGFGISPDGKKVAYSWNPGGTWEIFEKALNPTAKPHQLSAGRGGKFHPRYSPDGSSLAYVVDPDGSEHFHILLYDLHTGQQTDLTPDIVGSLQAYFAWSPDSRRIAFICDQSGQFDVYILVVEEARQGKYEPQLIFRGGYPAWKVSWSPDGKYLAAVVEASGIDYGTFIVPCEGGEPFRISDGGRSIDAGQPCWAPDSRHLAFSSDVNGYNNIGIFDVDTQKIRWLTDGEGEKQYPYWSPKGDSLVYIYNQGTVSWLAAHKLDGDPVFYQVEPGVHYSPVLTSDGHSIIFGFDNPRHPTDLWSVSMDDGQFHQLTCSLPKELLGAAFIMPEEITYPSLDGTPVPALLFKPETNGKGQAVLVVHGGPDWFFEMTWYPVMQALATRGWVVLVPNYRGSTGYGREWQEASRFDFGGVDTDDVAAGALYLSREGLADPKKIGITGRSHGGFLTASCLTRYPELWAVGSAVVPFLNWFTNHAEIRADLKQWDLENFGDPVEDRELWKERSPSFFLDRVQAPLQLICGRQDARCPISDSIKACEDMKELGKPVELIIYEDEGHVFLKKDNILDSELRRLKFLERYLS